MNDPARDSSALRVAHNRMVDACNALVRPDIMYSMSWNSTRRLQMQSGRQKGACSHLQGARPMPTVARPRLPSGEGAVE